MQVTNLAPKLAMCLQKQLVCLYMCWIAATGLALMFVILPGYQTLIKFQQTESVYDSQGSQKWLESVRILSASVCRDKGKIISDKTPSTRRTRQCQGKVYPQL